VGGTLLVAFPPVVRALQPVTILIASLLGAVFGLWVASLAGASVPNSRLSQFQPGSSREKLLLVVDVPFGQAERITEMVARRHPKPCREEPEPTIPSFPDCSFSWQLLLPFTRRITALSV
jgi:hypothetical protein